MTLRSYVFVCVCMRSVVAGVLSHKTQSISTMLVSWKRNNHSHRWVVIVQAPCAINDRTHLIYMQRECVHAAIVFRLFASIATSGVHRSPSVLTDIHQRRKTFPQKYRKCSSCPFWAKKKREHISIDMTVNVMPLVHYRFRFSASNGVLIHCDSSIYDSRTAISTACAVIGLCDMSFRFDLFSPPQWYFDKCYDGYVIIPIDERGGLNTHTRACKRQFMTFEWPDCDDWP